MCQTCITTKTCVHCEASLKPTELRLTKLHISALFKLRTAIRHFNREKPIVHARDDMYDVGQECPFRLTYDELNNLSVLRSHGLVYHGDPVNPRSGWWGLSPKGAAFLKGEIAVARKVFTFRGHTIDPPEPVKPVHILEYRKELPNFETYYDFTPRRSSDINQLTLA